MFYKISAYIKTDGCSDLSTADNVKQLNRKADSLDFRILLVTAVFQNVACENFEQIHLSQTYM